MSNAREDNCIRGDDGSLYKYLVVKTQCNTNPARLNEYNPLLICSRTFADATTTGSTVILRPNDVKNGGFETFVTNNYDDAVKHAQELAASDKCCDDAGGERFTIWEAKGITKAKRKPMLAECNVVGNTNKIYTHSVQAYLRDTKYPLDTRVVNEDRMPSIPASTLATSVDDAHRIIKGYQERLGSAAPMLIFTISEIREIITAAPAGSTVDVKHF